MSSCKGECRVGREYDSREIRIFASDPFRDPEFPLATSPTTTGRHEHTIYGLSFYYITTYVSHLIFCLPLHALVEANHIVPEIIVLFEACDDQLFSVLTNFVMLSRCHSSQATSDAVLFPFPTSKSVNSSTCSPSLSLS